MILLLQAPSAGITGMCQHVQQESEFLIKLPNDTNVASPQVTFWGSKGLHISDVHITLVKSQAQEPIELDIDCSSFFHFTAIFSRN
jgi:hypothetical protein